MPTNVQTLWERKCYNLRVCCAVTDYRCTYWAVRDCRSYCAVRIVDQLTVLSGIVDLLTVLSGISSASVPSSSFHGQSFMPQISAISSAVGPSVPLTPLSAGVRSTVEEIKWPNIPAEQKQTSGLQCRLENNMIVGQVVKVHVRISIKVHAHKPGLHRLESYLQCRTCSKCRRKALCGSPRFLC